MPTHAEVEKMAQAIRDKYGRNPIFKSMEDERGKQEFLDVQYESAVYLRDNPIKQHPKDKKRQIEYAMSEQMRQAHGNFKGGIRIK